MPTKALLRSSAALEAARRLPGAREAVTGALDVEALLERRDGFASHWHDDSQVDWLAGAGIDLVRGHGRLSGPRAVTVTDPAGVTILTARHAVIVATGTHAVVPPVLADIPVWTNRDAVAVGRIPARLAILGGGVVGVEMATAFARLGSSVTLLARDGVLPAHEPFAGELVTQALKDTGATVALGSGVTAARLDTTGAAVLTLDDGTELVVDQVLAAVGRGPNTADLGLETVGIEPASWLGVDETLRVRGTDWLYAVGDVNHRALVTHQGKYQARAAGDAIVVRAQGTPVDDAPWGRHAATADARAVPQVVFTDPEVAAVGLTAAQAERAGLRVRVVDHDLGAVAGSALHADGYTGRARMVVDEDRGVVVGMTFVGSDVAELVQAATIAIVGEVPLDRLWHAVPAFPTMSEVWLRLLESYGRPTVLATTIAS